MKRILVIWGIAILFMGGLLSLACNANNSVTHAAAAPAATPTQCYYSGNNDAVTAINMTTVMANADVAAYGVSLAKATTITQLSVYCSEASSASPMPGTDMLETALFSVKSGVATSVGSSGKVQVFSAPVTAQWVNIPMGSLSLAAGSYVIACRYTQDKANQTITTFTLGTSSAATGISYYTNVAGGITGSDTWSLPATLAPPVNYELNIKTCPF